MFKSFVEFCNKFARQWRRFNESLGLLGLLGSLLFVGALCMLWLLQFFGDTLTSLTASQLLEQEQQYLQQQITEQTIAVTELRPSRPYFKISTEPLPAQMERLSHDLSVVVIPPTEQSSTLYLRAIEFDHKSTLASESWLVLDVGRALPLYEFHLLLQGICVMLLIIFGGCSSWLLLRLRHTEQQLNEALQREQNFVNDISHELRTPLSLIHNALSLTEDTSLSGESLQLVKDANADMSHLIRVLLALARKQQTPRVKLALLPELEQVMLQLYQTEPAFVSQIVLELPEQLEVCGNPQLIRLLLYNLISNACYHSGCAVLQISYHEKILEFYNEINPLSFGDVRLSRRYQGFGHGSSLISRIAQELDWEVHTTANEHYYQVNLRL